MNPQAQDYQPTGYQGSYRQRNMDPGYPPRSNYPPQGGSHHHHNPQHHPHAFRPSAPPQPRQAVLVLDGIPGRRAANARAIADAWHHAPPYIKPVVLIDTEVAGELEDDAAGLLDSVLNQNQNNFAFVIAGFLWNNSHDIHHIAAVLMEKNISLVSVLFVDTENEDLMANEFQTIDKIAQPLYFEAATLYFNEKQGFFTAVDNLLGMLLHQPLPSLLECITSRPQEPPKPWGTELRMADYDKYVGLRSAIRALFGDDLRPKLPTLFLTYHVFARFHETLSKKCLVSFDFEGDRGHLVRFNNKDYLLFQTGLVFAAPEPYRAPGSGGSGIQFVFEVQSARKKENKKKEIEADFFVTDVVYFNGTNYDAHLYHERQKIVADFFKDEINCKWKPVPTFEVSKFNYKQHTEYDVAGYQFFENGGNKVFLFKMTETSTANLRMWGGVQDEKNLWTFTPQIVDDDNTGNEKDVPNAVVSATVEVVDRDKVHFGTVVRARMEKPGKKPEKVVWRMVDRNHTVNYPTAISRTSSPWTVDGLFTALASLNKE